jgi:hypothetical protein
MTTYILVGGLGSSAFIGCRHRSLSGRNVMKTLRIAQNPNEHGVCSSALGLGRRRSG